MSAAVGSNNQKLIDLFLQGVPKNLGPMHSRYLTDAARAVILGTKSKGLLNRLTSLGADPLLPLSQATGWSLLHYAAIIGDLTVFDSLIATARAEKSHDLWKRSPSDLAPDEIRPEFEARQKTWEEDWMRSQKLFSYARCADIVSLATLLQTGNVNPYIRDSWGRSPADHAPDKLRAEVDGLLKSSRYRN